MRGMIHDLIKIPQTIKTCALEVIHSIGLYRKIFCQKEGEFMFDMRLDKSNFTEKSYCIEDIKILDEITLIHAICEMLYEKCMKMRKLLGTSSKKTAA